ncbi:MAG: class I SAM-dependent methyltransferase [Candidatus Nealsonbacteria bacterium]|nr:class I SAM-dependent methyltransferase [Candidatus Nealsonbacteria bacterium]
MNEEKKPQRQEEIKEFYRHFGDDISDKRLDSPYPLRKFCHRMRYLNHLSHIKASDKILELGCGEGIFTVLAAKKGARVVATDISRPNLEKSRMLAQKESVLDRIEFMEADIENLPFKDNSFDLVVASHVLEHIPNFEKGLSEIYRVTKDKALIALPTCLGPCAWPILGKSWSGYWKFSRGSFPALLRGFFKVILGILEGKDGIEEGGYGGKEGIPHKYYYPWAIKKKVKKAGFKIILYEPDSLCLPYLSFLIPVLSFLNSFRGNPIFRYSGQWSHMLLQK